MVLNPVRAKMVALPEQWHWSSYDYCVRDRRAPLWLDTDWLLGQFGAKRRHARDAYAKFVLDGVGLASPLHATRHQLLLGDDQFVEKYQHQIRPDRIENGLDGPLGVARKDMGAQGQVPGYSPRLTAQSHFGCCEIALTDRQVLTTL